MSDNVKIFRSGEIENGGNLLSVLLKELQKEGGFFSPCAGGGKCGRCRVRFLEGAPLPTPTERTLLEPEELRSGIRLACLTKPVKDAVLDISALREQMDRNRDYEIATHCLLELPKTDTEPGNDKENAEKWINFLCRPDIAKKNFEYITYSTPNKGAFDLLDADLQNNKALFPDIDNLKNAEVLQYLGDEVDDLYNEAWKEVKAE